MIQDELGDDADSPFVSGFQESLEISESSVIGIDLKVVRDIVPVVTQWRRIERQNPDRCNAEILKIIEFLYETAEVSDTVPVSVPERLYMDLIDNRIFIPERVLRNTGIPV